MENEIWKKIKDFPDYEISNCGRVKRNKSGRNTYNGKILKEQPLNSGYACVNFYINNKRKTKLIHRLVLENFSPIDNMDKLQVNHINGIKTDNRLENLEWVTKSENEKHAYKIGLKKGHHISINIGEKNGMNKLTIKNVIGIKNILISNKYINGEIFNRNIAEKFNISTRTVIDIKLGKTWSYIKLENHE